ncbi:hypothetical protein J3B02_005519, partial [Coemansia erecta]
MGDNRVDIADIRSYSLENRRKNLLKGQLRSIKKNDEIVRSLNLVTPSVVEISCDAIPVPVCWDSKNKRRFAKAPLLLRPEITTSNNDRKSLYSFISEFASATFPSTDGSTKGLDTTMEVDSDDENDDNDALSTQLQSITIDSAQSAGQRHSPVSIDYLNRYMVLNGCLGNGKSYIMCELALRAIVNEEDLRVVYPLDCSKWSSKTTMTDALIYLVDALHVAFVEGSFLTQQLGGLGDESFYNIKEAINCLLEVLKPTNSGKGNNPRFRLLMFVDNYDNVSGYVKGIIDELMKQKWIFIVFAARANRPIEFNNNKFTISANYSRNEAEALIKWIVSKEENEFKFLSKPYSDETLTTDSDINELCSLVSEFTWLNPREINELFKRDRFSGDWEDFIEKANEFATCSGNGNIDDYLREIIESDKTFDEEFKSELH